MFAPDVVFQSIGGEGLLLGLNDEVVFSLNASGARIAQLIADRLDFGTMVETLAEEYGLSLEEIESDVVQLLDVLQSRGLIAGAAGGTP